MSSYRGVVKAGNNLSSLGVLLRLLGVPGGGADGELGPVVHVVPAHITHQTEWSRVDLGYALLQKRV